MTAAVVSLGLALAIVSGAAVLAIVWAAKRAMADSDRATDAVMSLGESQRARQHAESQLQQTARDLAEEHRRHEGQLTALRADIADLEADLATCTTPDATRARLARLLGLTEARARPAADRSGDRPPGVRLVAATISPSGEDR